MKRLIYMAIITLVLTSCKDEVSLEGFNNHPKLVVYCMPTASDTTYIYVSKSVPVKHYKDSVSVKWVNDAHIHYTVNGESRYVERIGEGYYRVTGRQQTGDNIALRVSVEGMDNINSSTTIPESVPVSNIKVRTVSVFDGNNSMTKIYDQVSATFADNAASHDYYAVRIRLKHYAGSAIGYGENGHRVTHFTNYDQYLLEKDRMSLDSVHIVFSDSVYSYPEIHTESEALLTPPTPLDEEFGFSNGFFGNLCIFDDNSINGQTHTLRLNIDKEDKFSLRIKRKDFFQNFDFAKAYQVELLRISPEYFHFLRTLKEMDNNELARAGFSQIRPMQSNILGGLGLMGGWEKATTQWIMRGASQDQ